MMKASEDLSRYEKPISAGYYLSFLCQGLTGSIFGPAMIWFAARTNSTVSGITPVLVCYNLGFILASLSLTNLFNKKPGNRLIAGSIFLLSAVMLGFCGVRNRWQLFLLAFVMGAVLSVIENGGNILFPWLLGERSKRPMNIIHLFYSVGCIITPFLIGLALKRWAEVTPIFLLLAVLIIFPAIFLFRLPSPSPLRSSTTDPAAGQTEIPGAVLLFGLLLFLFSSCESTYNNWISTVLIQNGLADDAAAAVMTSVFWSGAFIGRLLAAWLVGKYRAEQIVLYGMLIAVADGIAMFFARDSLILIAICVFFNGFATGPILANILSIMKGQGLLSAIINGIVLACSQLGVMLLPALFGRIWGDSSDSFLPFVIITLSASCAELFVLRLVLRKKK